MSKDLPDFEFSGLPKPVQAMDLIKTVDQRRIFEITAEGSIKIHGYDVDEVIKLLAAHREHMVKFGQDMQGLSHSQDAATYRPGDGGYQ